MRMHTGHHSAVFLHRARSRQLGRAALLGGGHGQRLTSRFCTWIEGPHVSLWAGEGVGNRAYAVVWSSGQMRRN